MGEVMREKYLHKYCTRKPNSDRDALVRAFSRAWRDGEKFHISLTSEGTVVAKIGKKTVAYYEDAERFAMEFMPEVLTGQ